MIGGTIRHSSPIEVSDSNLSSGFLTTLANFRKGGNEAFKANSYQKSNMSEIVTNKFFLKKNLEGESESESDSDVNFESKDDDDNDDSIVTSSQDS